MKELLQNLSIPEQIEQQRQEEGERDYPIHALDAPVLAQPHTPVYKMHRYFARRPWNVFEKLITHYSEPGDVVLDPFCGGGVTIVEGLRKRRKVIGVDLNPMATFITKMEVMPVDLDAFEKAFRQVESQVKDRINDLYRTQCPKCRKPTAIAEWYEWSNVIECDQCHQKVILGKAKRQKGAKFGCTNEACRAAIRPHRSNRLKDEMLRLKFLCESCGHKGIKEAQAFDSRSYQWIIDQFSTIVHNENLWYPTDEFPDCNMQRESALFDKGFTHFYKFFTERNLLALSVLFQQISKVEEEKLRLLLMMTFSATLDYATKISRVVQGQGREITLHAFWPPYAPCENNVWRCFEKRFEAARKGKEHSQKEIGSFCRFADSFSDLKADVGTCLLLTQSSHSLPLPDNSVDVIITDPPFGGNVFYVDMSNLWAVWLRDLIGVNGVVNDEFEAVQSRRSGFPGVKSREHYENMLYEIFRESHRVLKENGWMVLTFHNRDIGVWMSLHRAAARAGFCLPNKEEERNRGMIYQPPIESYTTTLHQKRSGAMLGDFILSFKRLEKTSHLDDIQQALTIEEESELIDRVKEFIEYHGGADDSTLMTGLIPYLEEKGLIYRLAQLDFSAIFKRNFHFERKSQKWYIREMIDPDTKTLRLLDFIPAEQQTERLVLGYLRDREYATMDELLILIYTNLVNSQRPGIEAITRVIHRLCDKGKPPQTMGRRKPREVFRLKLDATRRISAVTDMPYPEGRQLSLFGDVELRDHDPIIHHVGSVAIREGFDVHIGEMEQRKGPAFREMSIAMVDNTQFGIPRDIFESIIKEIDLLVLKHHVIRFAFEVATTISTLNKAINDRFRNLLAVIPNIPIQLFAIVLPKDMKKARSELYTPANQQVGLSRKVRLLSTTELSEKKIRELLSEGP